jgi:hypothetical protein
LAGPAPRRLRSAGTSRSSAIIHRYVCANWQRRQLTAKAARFRKSIDPVYIVPVFHRIRSINYFATAPARARAVVRFVVWSVSRFITVVKRSVRIYLVQFTMETCISAFAHCPPSLVFRLPSTPDRKGKVCRLKVGFSIVQTALGAMRCTCYDLGQPGQPIMLIGLLAE